MKQIDLQEGARRQHRAVALYATLQCWVRGLDGVIFERDQLLRLLGLNRFKETRCDWLQKDLRPLFPHQEMYTSDESDSLGSLLVSRKRFPKSGTSQRECLKACKENGILIENFMLWESVHIEEDEGQLETLAPFFGESGNTDERLLTAYLSLIATGQMSPLDIPKIRPEQK